MVEGNRSSEISVNCLEQRFLVDVSLTAVGCAIYRVSPLVATVFDFGVWGRGLIDLGRLDCNRPPASLKDIAGFSVNRQAPMSQRCLGRRNA